MFVLEHNGHTMEINRFCGQGGEVEDVYLWCHTCDPEGKDIMTIDVMGSHGLMLSAVGLLMDRSREHAEKDIEE